MKRKILTPPLTQTHPELVKEWHPTKNHPLSPLEVTHGMSKKVWWKCHLGHEWEATINQRSSKQTRCPFCSGQRLQIGINDLATTNPELAKEWHPTKNEELTPQDVRKGSSRKVWWICPHGHEWKATILNRSNGSGCPICQGRRVLVGFNDLKTTHPQLIKEWHPTKNDNLTPQMVSKGTNRYVWWQCEHGHEWEASVIQRTLLNNRCPSCFPRGIKIGVNDLATKRPDLAKEWHPTKNTDLSLTTVSCHSPLIAWWQCPHGHEWKQKILYRYRGANCPYCKRLLKNGG